MLIALGLLALCIPTGISLATKVWVLDEQGHGPFILAVSLWMLWTDREALLATPNRPAPVPGWILFGLASLLYIVGRSQAVLMLEGFALILYVVALCLLVGGSALLRKAWFPIFFLLFMVPLPATLVIMVTTPLKSAVSAVASQILHVLDYPIGRSGVVLTVGPYQLLVADACAGLNSMFTLEALGILYMKLMRYTSVVRNLTLAVLIIPIAFSANVIRVIILVLVTYHFGDEAGQGFVHGFAGIVLFGVALALMLAVDHLLRWSTMKHPAGAR